MFLPVFIKRANDAAGVACGDAVGRDVAVDDAACADDAVVADGDVGEDDAPAADEAVFSYADGTVDDRLGVAVGEVPDDARGGVVGDECHVETNGGVVADGYKVGLGRKYYGGNRLDNTDVFPNMGPLLAEYVNQIVRRIFRSSFSCQESFE